MRPILFFLLLLTSPLFAQLPLLSDDQFDAPTSVWYWSDVDDANNYRKIRNGVMYAEHRGTQIYWTLRATPLHPQKDYRLESRFKAVEPMTKGMYHIILKGADDMYLYFGINTENQTYWIGTEQKGQWVTYSAQTNGYPKCEGVKTGLADNILYIDYTGGVFSFRVNEVSIAETIVVKDKAPALGANLAYVGIATNQPMKVETDYFKMYQDNPVNLLTTKVYDVQKEVLGPEVNTTNYEKWPVVSPDGKTLYFVRSADPIMKPLYGDTDDIFVSTMDESGSWTKAVPLPSPVNNTGHNSVMTVTPDNNTLLLMHRYNADGTPGPAGFSISHRDKDGWTLPADVAMTNYYNESSTNEFYLSTDQRVMVMTIKRKDTYGDKDIYVSLKQEDGTYSEPLNLGPVVNTYSSEISPFLAADGKTLYFSSAGHAGFGDADVFMSRRLDDTWTNWSKPQNLGSSINTTGWEAYFNIPASGAFAYMVFNGDILRMKLPLEFRPEPVVIVSGRVLDSKTKKPLDASIAYSTLITADVAGTATSSPQDGTYKIALPAGKKWGFQAQKQEYYAVSENLDLTGLKEYAEVTKDLYLTPIEKGQVVRLNNIFFDFNKSDLKPESFPELDRLAQLLKDNEQMVIEISGHTDNVGDDAYNLKLSQTRSDAVMKYVGTKGIGNGRVTSKGYGEGKPVSQNTNDQGRAENRRVEFVIVKL